MLGVVNVGRGVGEGEERYGERDVGGESGKVSREVSGECVGVWGRDVGWVWGCGKRCRVSLKDVGRGVGNV